MDGIQKILTTHSIESTALTVIKSFDCEFAVKTSLISSAKYVRLCHNFAF